MPRFLHIDSDTLEVAIVEEGLPSFTGVVPAPMCSQEERDRRLQAAREGVWLDGMFITAERPVHNDAFDARGERSSTELEWRPCVNEQEAEFVANQVKRLLEAKHAELRLQRSLRDAGQLP